VKDIQNQRDYRNIPINEVGIKNLRYPITVRDRRDGFQHTVASISMYVDLPHEYKGTHMSRFVEMLHLLQPEVSLEKFSVILENMKKHLNAASAHMEMTFPYFIEKKAPVSTSPGMMDYTCSIVGSSDADGKVDLVSEVVVPISSVCPCSMEISDFGAHNHVTEKAFSNPKFVEDIVRDVAKQLQADDNITWFSVSAENFESIHNHSAYAHITSS
jgi:GTP cyclohydrolase I